MQKAGSSTDLPALAPRTTIFGATGGGKSVLARKLVAKADHRRVIILDPSDDWSRALGKKPVKGRRGIAEYFAKSRPDRMVIVQPGDYAADAEYLAALAMYAQRAVAEGRADYRMLIVFDEASEAVPSAQPVGKHMKSLIMRGRHSQIDMLAIAQRPTGVHPDYRSNAALKLFYPVHDAIDQRTVADAIGKDGLARLMALPKYTALARDFDGNTVEVEPDAK